MYAIKNGNHYLEAIFHDDVWMTWDINKAMTFSSKALAQNCIRRLGYTPGYKIVKIGEED